MCRWHHADLHSSVPIEQTPPMALAEAACKTLALRLWGYGMRWDRPNAEALLTLVALDQSRLWKPHWNLVAEGRYLMPQSTARPTQMSNGVCLAVRMAVR